MQRKRGAQPDNENAVTHGRHSRRRRAERAAEAEQRLAQQRQWMLTIHPIDYGAICDAIAKESRK